MNAGTLIVLGVLLLVVAAAVMSSVKHFKGEGGCCGGGSKVPKPRKQKLKQVVSSRKIYIEGMHCENCCKNVENALNALEQVNAKVNLQEKTAAVRLGVDISDEELKATVESLGYHVTGIENIGV